MPVAVAVRINGVLRDHKTDLSTDSVFPVYSITKTLAAICVLRLVELGSLFLDVPIHSWLPQVELPATAGNFYAAEAAGGRTQKLTPKAGADPSKLVGPPPPLSPLAVK